MIVELSILIIVVLFIGFIFKFLRKIIYLVINSIIGLLALFGYNMLFTQNVAVNIWTMFIVGLGGSVGFIIVLVFHYLGLAF